MARKSLLVKVSRGLIALMIISLLVPVLAFAAGGFQGITYNSDGTVTGTVYYDGGETVANSVYLDVTDLNGTSLGVVEATYSNEENGVRYYTFQNASTGQVNNATPIRIQEQVTSVTEEVYAQSHHVHGYINLNGAAAAGTTVTATSGNTVVTATYGATNFMAAGSQLHYSFDGLPSGTYSITATSGSYSSTTSHAVTENVDIEKHNGIYYLVNAVPALTLQTSGGGGGGGGGGYYPTPTPTPQDGVLNITVGNEVAANALLAAFADRDDVTVTVKGDFLEVPVSALIEAAKRPGTSLTIITDNGSYILPLSALNFSHFATVLDTGMTDLTMIVRMEMVSNEAATKINTKATSLGAKLLSDSIDFTINFEGKDNKKSPLESFGKTYVSRTLNLNENANTTHATGAWYDPQTGDLAFVPSTFSTLNGKTTATLKRNSNSIYTVVELNKSFSDIPASHWSKEEVELLASKLVIAGVTPNTFAPDADVTRAEFAALVVRSLGLSITAGVSFDDVSADAWYSEEVATATAAGLIVGYEDGTFRPNAKISRAELASLVVRAMAYAGGDTSITAAEQSNALKGFTDSSEAAWATKDLAVAIDAGIVYGVGNNKLAPSATATRAEAAAMLSRYLIEIGFMN